MYSGFGNNWDRDNIPHQENNSQKKFKKDDRVMIVQTDEVILAEIGKITKHGIFLRGVPGSFKSKQIYHITRSKLESLGVVDDDADEILSGQRNLPIVGKK